MKLRVFPLLFNSEGGLFMPRDAHLHQLACDFAQQEMGAIPNFVQYARVFVACEVDENYKPISVRGLSTFRMVADIQDMRFTDAKTAKLLTDRMHDWLQDQGVPGGTDVFVRIASGDDPYRCPQYQDWLGRHRARPAERWVLPTR